MDAATAHSLPPRLAAVASPAAADPAATVPGTTHQAMAGMLSYIAHEIGNPVNAIRGFAQLMQASPLPAGQAERLSHILEAVDRLKHLIADLGDIARMEAGQFSIETRSIELDSFLGQACAPAQAQAAVAGLRLALRRPAGMVRVRADERRLRQCLDNLLSNAMKYGHGGGRIDIEVERRDPHVVVAVQDHGDGLSASQMDQLFEPYNRLGRDGGAIPGTGLGLTLTRELMRAMGGRLRVHSEGTGRGARFELVLRAAED
jgi:signal transduction histidine kinase